MDNYDDLNRKVSKKYDWSLQTGDFRTAVSCLDALIQIAEEECRPNDVEILRDARSKIADICYKVIE